MPVRPKNLIAVDPPENQPVPVDPDKAASDIARSEEDRAARRALVGGLRVQGYTYREIAAITKLTPRQVEITVAELRNRSELTKGLKETIDRVENEALPLALESLLDLLRAGDRAAPLETLKGKGIFRRYDESTSVGQSDAPPFQINILSTEGAVNVQLAEGAVKGTPRTLATLNAPPKPPEIEP